MRWLPLLLVAFLTLPVDAFAAYTQSAVTTVRYTLNGVACTVYTYTETEVASSSDASISLVSPLGVIVSIKQTLTAGTGATLNPKIGRAAAFTVSTQSHIATAVTTAAHVNEQGSTYFYASGSTLYVRSSPNAGSDNAVSTEIIICAGTP